MWPGHIPRTKVIALPQVTGSTGLSILGLELHPPHILLYLGMMKAQLLLASVHCNFPYDSTIARHTFLKNPFLNDPSLNYPPLSVLFVCR